MTEAAEDLNFEKAARIRDRLASLKETLEKQKAVMLDFSDRDVIGLHRAAETGPLRPIDARLEVVEQIKPRREEAQGRLGAWGGSVGIADHH